MYPLEDTITAIASAHGLHGLRGVVRLSGPNSLSVLETCGIQIPAEEKRQAFHFQTKFELELGISLPCGIYVWKNGRSFTGQDAAEIHTLGVLPFLERLTEKLCRTQLVRMAQPGEFTLRAFLSGRLDLTQAEAVLGTIEAQNPKKLEAALHQLAGGLAVPLQNLREKLFELLGHLEAGFDFADEDIEFISAPEIALQLAESSETIRGILEKMRSRSGAGALPNVVFYGAPNIGKSALFNALLGEEAALVFDQPGTTRDYLCAVLELGECSCRLIDTAGDFQETKKGTENERETENEKGTETEKEDEISAAKESFPQSAPSFLDEKSQELARTQKELADIPLFCFDAQEFILSRSDALQILSEKTVGDALVLLTRSDLPTEEQKEDFRRKLSASLTQRVLWTSSLTGAGIEKVRERLTRILSERANDESDVVASTQVRCRESLQTALESLERAALLCGTEFQELIATEIRTALDQVGLMVGAIYTEDLLDSIFSRFCVGK